MTTIESITSSTIQLPEPEVLADESQLAAAAFLARYSGRTLDAYRHDLRGFFQWGRHWACRVGCDSTAGRVVPVRGGRARAGGFDDPRLSHRAARLL
jgi:hypothetical protein